MSSASCRGTSGCSPVRRAEQSTTALTLVDSQILSRIGSFLLRLRPTADFLDEVKQLIRAKLFVAADGRPPKIIDYSGAGSLANWVRVLSVRTAIDLQRQAPAYERHVKLISAEPQFARVEDQDLAQIKELYGDQINAALRRALAATSTEQRNLLRLHFVEGVTFDALAEMFNMHKVTVWRKIDAARVAVLVAARQILEVELKIPASEFDSLIQRMQSLVDVSLPSFLKATASPLGTCARCQQRYRREQGAAAASTVGRRRSIVSIQNCRRDIF
jgi:RNA polymerase sigma-70 factor (ECF subfamily)